MKSFVILLLVVFSFLWMPNFIAADSINAVEIKEKFLKLVGGEKAKEVITKYEKVEIFRLADESEKKVISEGIKLSSEKSKILSKLLTDYKTYVWEDGNKCIPDWGVMFVFYKGNDKVEVMLCLDCDIIKFINGGEEEINPIRVELLAIIKPMFPNDKKIQDLK